MAARRRWWRLQEERGFTLVEFLIASAIVTAVLGGSVMLASQLQQAYATRLDDTTVEEEVRFALDWIGQALRNAGSNPYGIGTFTAIQITGDNQIRINADINPPDGDILDPNENVTITIDTGQRVITRRDWNVDMAPVSMSEPVVSDLDFTYLDANRAVTTTAAEVAYVRVRVTGRSQAYSVVLGEFTETALETEVRVRMR